MRKSYDVRIGGILKAVRESFSCTQDQVCNDTGIDISRLRRLEHGKVKMYADELFELCVYFGISFEQVMRKDIFDTMVQAKQEREAEFKKLVEKEKLRLGSIFPTKN